MKTREELLANTWKPDEDVNIGSYVIRQGKLGKILNAPTEKQLDCPYCHNDPKQADLLKKYTDDNMYIVYLKSNTLNLEAAGLRVSEKVKFCPVCGRKLGDE